MLSFILFSSISSADEIKNIILFIGDGMGPQQVGLLETYATRANSKAYKNKTTALSQLMKSGEVAISNHHPKNAMVVDSACSATQLATGKYSSSERVGVDHKGNKTRTILELAKSMGKSVGLVTDTRITHATPAAFATHQMHRSLSSEIAEELVNSDIDVAFAAGLYNFLPSNLTDAQKKKLKQRAQIPYKIKSKRKDSKNLLVELEKKYKVVFNKDQFNKIKSTDKKVWGFFGNKAMPSGLEYKRPQTKKDFPTHSAVTKKALDILSKNEKGFFLMVEAGQIDWAGHQNDAGMLLHEMMKADNTVSTIKKWLDQRGVKDTLFLVTADHETGGFGFSYSSNLKAQPKKNGPQFNFGSKNALRKLASQTETQFDMLMKANEKPKKQVAKHLISQIKSNLGYDVSYDEIKSLLETRKNPFHFKKHKNLKAKHVANMHENIEYHPYFDGYSGKLAKIISTHSNIVWATGTHTSTPVYVISYGPKRATDKFKGYLHHTDVGARLQSLFDAPVSRR